MVKVVVSRIVVGALLLSIMTSVCLGDERITLKLGVLQSLTGHAREDGTNEIGVLSEILKSGLKNYRGSMLIQRMMQPI